MFSLSSQVARTFARGGRPGGSLSGPVLWAPSGPACHRVPGVQLCGVGAHPRADSLGGSPFALREGVGITLGGRKAPCAGGMPFLPVGGRGRPRWAGWEEPRPCPGDTGSRGGFQAQGARWGQGLMGAGVRGGVGRPWAAAGGDGEKSRDLRGTRA